jgi:Caspase recruitment domain
MIRQNFNLLLDGVNPRDSGLIDVLYQELVIVLEEKEFIIEAGGGGVRQMERLLSVLSRKPSDQFNKFLNALVQVGQQHVADVLRGEASDVLG